MTEGWPSPLMSGKALVKHLAVFLERKCQTHDAEDEKGLCRPEYQMDTSVDGSDSLAASQSQAHSQCPSQSQSSSQPRSPLPSPTRALSLSQSMGETVAASLDLPCGPDDSSCNGCDPGAEVEPNEEHRQEKQPLKESQAATLRHLSSDTIPAIGIKDYLLRIEKHASPGVEALVKLVPMLHRLEQMGFRLSRHSVYRFCAVGLLLGAKSTQDAVYLNSYYSKVAGLNIKALNLLELELFILFDFRLHATTAELLEAYQMLAAIDID
eukprot:m.30135 g.30135  ORF g.30135 m.30135 type:complete len:267 (+) comp9249_c0_seq2:266-1066(+)